ncbi:MAG: hypothetical protein UT00_C0033G0005 [Parcubacteria group bacterium GW2011_GWA1_38_7]|nr:MAG: hypothetical protein UT00_C0033G0005 [Parcubacteria group bacterium GW2011_GWA1_38_7]
MIELIAEDNCVWVGRIGSFEGERILADTTEKAAEVITRGKGYIAVVDSHILACDIQEYLLTPSKIDA